ncbi:hypothetical protein [Nostoc sp.]|uniref:hypothetical protein n=1 Tax=Nostoc sp. TaxID=1180 RepID=UPI002FF30471
MSADWRLAGIVGEKAMFCFNEGSNRLHYAEELDVAVCEDIKDTKPKLFNLLSSRIDS